MLEEECGSGTPAWAAARQRWLAPPEQLRAPSLSCSEHWAALVTQTLVVCPAFRSCQAMILLWFCSRSFSTQAINEYVMPAEPLHCSGSRQSSLDTSSYQTAMYGVSMGCLINRANRNDKLGGDIEPELCMGIFQPKKITLITEQVYVLSLCCSYWEMISRSATRNKKRCNKGINLDLKYLL